MDPNLYCQSFVNDLPESSEGDIVPQPSMVTDDYCIDDGASISESQAMINVKVGPQLFDILHLIGEGAFGKVLLVRNRINGVHHAMKVISKKLLRKKNNIQYMKSERDILTLINHPFIVSLNYAFQTDSKVFLVMDFLGGGELFYHLRKRGIILESDARIYFSEMILAIEFLHSIGVIHRDLKPENVLLKINGHICLTDFGLAKEIGDGVTTRTLCGTSEYMAPEMLTRNGYSKAVDWWSLGALFYEVLAGKAPFTAKSQKELDRKILSERLSLPSYLSASAHSLLKGMLERDVNKRLGAAKSTMFSIGGVSALKQHDFFKGLNFYDVLHGLVTPPMDLMAAKNLSAEPCTSPDDVNSMNAVLVANFHEDFTRQCISPSVLEDCYSVSNSAMQTPSTRSRANSAGRCASPEASAIVDPNEEFANFDYSLSPIECTEEFYKKFEADLTLKLNKLQKKKSGKLKKEEERADKLAAAKLQKEAEEKMANEREAEKERQAIKQAELQRAVNDLNRKRSNLSSDLIAIERSVLQCEGILTPHAAEIEKTQKKLKSVRKKLRDIADLEAKDPSSSLTSEQKEKLTRKTELVRCAADLEAASCRQAEPLEGIIDGKAVCDVEGHLSALLQRLTALKSGILAVDQSLSLLTIATDAAAGSSDGAQDGDKSAVESPVKPQSEVSVTAKSSLPSADTKFQVASSTAFSHTSRIASTSTSSSTSTTSNATSSTTNSTTSSTVAITTCTTTTTTSSPISSQVTSDEERKKPDKQPVEVWESVTSPSKRRLNKR